MKPKERVNWQTDLISIFLHINFYVVIRKSLQIGSQIYHIILNIYIYINVIYIVYIF